LGVTKEEATKRFNESQAKEKQHQANNPTSAGSPVGETSSQKADRLASGVSSGGQSEASKQLALHGITFDNITQERFNSLSVDAQAEILNQQQQYIDSLRKTNESFESNQLGSKEYSSLTLDEANYLPSAKASVTTEKYDSRSPELKNILGNIDSYYKQKEKLEFGDIPNYASKDYRIEGEEEGSFFRTKRGDLGKKKGKTSITEIYKMKDYADKAVRLDFGESELIGRESSSTSKYSPMDDLGTWTITRTQGKSKMNMPLYKDFKSDLSGFSKKVKEIKPDKISINFVEGGVQKTIPINPNRVAYDIQKQRVELAKRGMTGFSYSYSKSPTTTTTTKYTDGQVVSVKDLPVNWSGQLPKTKSDSVSKISQTKEGKTFVTSGGVTKERKNDLGLIAFQYGDKSGGKVKDLSKNRNYKEDDPRYYAEQATRPLDNLFKMGANLLDEGTGESKKARYVPYELKQTIEDKFFALGDEPLANLGLDKQLLFTGEKRDVTPLSTAVSDITKIKPVELLQLPATAVTWLAGGYAAKPVTKGIQLVGTQALKKVALSTVTTLQKSGALGELEVAGVKTLSGRTVQVMFKTTEPRGKTVTASIDILKQQKGIEKIKALEIKRAKTSTELQKLYTPSSSKITTPAKNTVIATRQAKLNDRLEQLDKMINKAKNKLPEESLYGETFKTPKGIFKSPKQIIPKEAGSDVPLESLIFTKGKKGFEMVVMGGKRTDLSEYEAKTLLSGAVIQGRAPSKLLAGVKIKKNVYGIPKFGGKSKAVTDKFKEVELGKRVWEVQGLGTKTAESLTKLEDVEWLKGVGDIYKFKVSDITAKPQEFGKFLRDPNVLGKETIGFERIGKGTQEYGQIAKQMLAPEDIGVTVKPTLPKSIKIIRDPTKLYSQGIARYYESKVEPFLQESVKKGGLPKNYPKEPTTTLGKLKAKIKPQKYPEYNPFTGKEPRGLPTEQIMPSEGSQLLTQMNIEKVKYPDLSKLYSSTGIKAARPLATGVFAVLTGQEVGKKTSGTRTIKEIQPSQLIKTTKFKEEKRTRDAFGDIYTQTEKAMLQEERQRAKQDYYSEQLYSPRQGTKQKTGLDTKNLFRNIMTTQQRTIQDTKGLGKIEPIEQLKLDTLFTPIIIPKIKDKPDFKFTPLIKLDIDEGYKLDQPQKITTTQKQGYVFKQIFDVPYDKPVDIVPEIPPEISGVPRTGKGGLFPFGDSSYVDNDAKGFGKFFRVYDVGKEPFGEIKVRLGYFEDEPYAFNEITGFGKQRKIRKRKR